MAKHLNLSLRKNRLYLYIYIRWNPCEATSPSFAPARQRETWATMRQQEPSLTDELIVKQSFISLLLPFVPKWEKGQSVDNIRVAINTAWTTRKKTIRQAGR
jgi:hypothetical protein